MTGRYSPTWLRPRSVTPSGSSPLTPGSASSKGTNVLALPLVKLRTPPMHVCRPVLIRNNCHRLQYFFPSGGEHKQPMYASKDYSDIFACANRMTTFSAPWRLTYEIICAAGQVHWPNAPSTKMRPSATKVGLKIFRRCPVKVKFF
jgi:hypothetical protein